MKMLTRMRHLVMLTCKDVNQFLVDYLEGTLDPRLRRRFERHLARCPQCSAYLDQYRQTIALVKEDGEVALDPPEELVELTLSFLRRHRDGENR